MTEDAARPVFAMAEADPSPHKARAGQGGRTPPPGQRPRGRGYPLLPPKTPPGG